MTLQTLPPNLELPMLQPPRKPFRFSSDHQPVGKRGRKPGAINKITTDLKHGILRGAASCGYDGEGLGGVDGFLLMCAQRYPKHYLNLMGKLLPLNLTANAPSAGIGTVNIVSVPSGTYLSPDQIARAQRGEPFTIEHGPTTKQPPPVEEPIVQEFSPRTERERQLLAELEALSPEQLLERARQAGYVDVDGI